MLTLNYFVRIHKMVESLFNNYYKYAEFESLVSMLQTHSPRFPLCPLIEI